MKSRGLKAQGAARTHRGEAQGRVLSKHVIPPVRYTVEPRLMAWAVHLGSSIEETCVSEPCRGTTSRLGGAPGVLLERKLCKRWKGVLPRFVSTPGQCLLVCVKKHANPALGFV